MPGTRSDAPAAPARLAVRDDDVHRARKLALRGAPSALAAPGPLSVGEAVSSHARARPAGVAVVHDGSSLSYPELLGHARALADRLRAAGASPGDVVALLAPRSALTVVTLLAVEIVRAVYLPLAQEWPDHRRESLLRSSGARLLVTPGDSPVTGAVEPVGPGCDPACRRTPPPGDPDVAHRPEDVAYVIYTSGSTGEPKGAQVERRGMMNHVRAKVDDLRLGPDDRVAFTAPVVFDVSVWQIAAALVAGGCVVVVPERETQFPRLLRRALVRERATVAELVPTALRLLLDDLERRAVVLPDLRHLLSTGEELSPALARRAARLLPHVRLLNAYGPTECSDDVTHHVVTAEDHDRLRVPVGRPVAGTALYVLRRVGERWGACDHGETGELFVGGVGVGPGYLGDPARTAQAFFADELDPSSVTGRLYRTGDLARLTDGGVLEYLGRTDRQVKIAGVRVELGEIEAVVSSHPGVAACAVTVERQDGPAADGGARGIVCHYVPRDGIVTDALLDYVRARLPAAMVPRKWDARTAFPVTVNGKIDTATMAAEHDASSAR